MRDPGVFKIFRPNLFFLLSSEKDDEVVSDARRLSEHNETERQLARLPATLHTSPGNHRQTHRAREICEMLFGMKVENIAKFYYDKNNKVVLWFRPCQQHITEPVQDIENWASWYISEMNLLLSSVKHLLLLTDLGCLPTYFSCADLNIVTMPTRAQKPSEPRVHVISLQSQADTDLLLLGLSAAFNTVDHDVLSDRLENQFGISGLDLAWLKSYLSVSYITCCVVSHHIVLCIVS